MTVTRYQLLAGSGPGAGDQDDPGLSRDLFDFDDTDDENLNQILKLM